MCGVGGQRAGVEREDEGLSMSESEASSSRAACSLWHDSQARFTSHDIEERRRRKREQPRVCLPKEGWVAGPSPVQTPLLPDPGRWKGENRRAASFEAAVLMRMSVQRSRVRRVVEGQDAGETNRDEALQALVPRPKAR